MPQYFYKMYRIHEIKHKIIICLSNSENSAALSGMFCTMATFFLPFPSQKMQGQNGIRVPFHTPRSLIIASEDTDEQVLIWKGRGLQNYSAQLAFCKALSCGAKFAMGSNNQDSGHKLITLITVKIQMRMRRRK